MNDQKTKCIECYDHISIDDAIISNQKTYCPFCKFKIDQEKYLETMY